MFGLLVYVNDFESCLGFLIRDFAGGIVQNRKANPWSQSIRFAEIQVYRIAAIGDFGDFTLDVLKIFAFDFLELLAEDLVLLGEFIAFPGDFSDLFLVLGFFRFALFGHPLLFRLDLRDLVLTLFLLLRVGHGGLLELASQRIRPLAFGFGVDRPLLQGRFLVGVELDCFSGLCFDLDIIFPDRLYQCLNELAVVFLGGIGAEQGHIGVVLFLDVSHFRSVGE